MSNAISQNGVNDPSAWRYTCWLNKLNNHNVDDRIIEWKHICNRQSVGTLTGTPFSTSCKLLSEFRYISESEMHEKIKSISDVNVLNDSRMMTKMKDNIFNYGETGVYKHNMPVPHDETQRTIEVLREWADSPQGFNTMPDYYVHIMGWIRQQQRNPLSLYSCL